MDFMHVTPHVPTYDFFGGSHWSIPTADEQTLYTIGYLLPAVTS
ncbi:unnamed protein product, partial [Larinioides sclopetarius]